ncbi:MAG TPA: AsmA family protein [Marinagarivorans sp.]
MRKITIGLSVVVGLPLILAAGAVAFVLTLDPNRLKPIIEEAAYQQGLELDLAGDLSWRFFPNIGLQVAGVQVRNASTQEPLAKLDSAGLSVAFKPLLQRKIVVNGVDINGASLNYWLGEQGQSNWPIPTADDAEPAKPAPPTADPQIPALDISFLSFTDLAVNYRDASGATTDITGLNLSAQNFNLQGYSFDAQLDGSVAHADLPVIALEAEATMSLDLAVQRMVIETLTAALVVGGEHKVIAQANAKLSAKLDADITWGDGLAVKGMLKADTLDLRALLEQLGVALPVTRSPEVFKALAIESRIALTDTDLSLRDMMVTLDDMALRAGIEIVQFDAPQIDATLSIDQVALDPYMAPPATATEQEAPAAATKPTPLPLEALRSLNARLVLDIGKLLVKGVEASAISLKLAARDGLIELKPAELTVAGGQADAQLSFDARKASAAVKGQVTTTGVMVDMLLKQLNQAPILAGALNSRVTFTTGGVTDVDLADNLLADIGIDSTHVKLTTINIEKRFCEAVALLKGKAASENNWPEYTELAPLQLNARFADGKVVLEGLAAEIQKLKAESTGQIDLNTGEFRFPLDVRLAEFATSLEGCVIVDDKWRQRSVPLRCKGNLSDIGARTCLPDGPRITEKLKQQAKEELDEELTKAKDKLSDKAKKEADRFLDKHVDESDVDKLKDSVKDLFNRK